MKRLQWIVVFTFVGAQHASAEDGETSSSENSSSEIISSEASGSSDAALTLDSSSTAPRMRVGGFLGGNYLSAENELGNSFHNDQVPGSGFLLGLRGSYLLLDSIAPESRANPQLSAELEGKFTFSSTDGQSASGRDSISTPVAGWRANLVLDLFPHAKVIPFALAGIGGETVFGSNMFMRSPDTDFATYLGWGVRYPVADHVDLRGDLRFGLTAGRYDALSSLGELHVGVAYNFGMAEEPPLEPVVAIVPEPKVADSDSDGIPDSDDDCPDLPEVFNEIDDEDGCPEVDSDNDGLLGSRDQCPAAAEDADGYLDEDGCPDPDNDNDGRPDVVDKCPLEAETLNGYEDEDGCPDDVPEQVQKFTGTIDGIVFKTGSARILPKSYGTLNRAVKVLSEYASVRIEISGHTDSQGKLENNQILSRKRADYVKWYLIDKGIAADRIHTIGYGPDRPVADNDTKDGRQKNRRIEFRLLPGAASVESSDVESPDAEKTDTPAAGSE